LAATLRANAEPRPRGRRPAGGRSAARRRTAAFAAVAAALAYFARRPTLARVVIGVIAVALALCAYPYFASRLPAKEQAKIETPHVVTLAPAPKPPAAPEEHASPSVVATPAPPRRVEEPTPPRRIDETASTRHADEAASRPKPLPPIKAALAQRDPALDSWFIKTYLRCWTQPSSLPQGDTYAAAIRVAHNADGSLSAAPVLVNPPSDPEWRAYANSAIRAVKKCNPIQVPAQYAAHYDQWKKMTLYFSPDSAL
jgi:hypothetical protein